MNDVRARIDEEVVLHAAIEASKNGRCVLFTDAPRAVTRCAIEKPPAELDVAWSKIEAEEKAYDNVPDGKFRAAPIAFVESPWARGRWSVRADVRPIVRAALANDGPASRA